MAPLIGGFLYVVFHLYSRLQKLERGKGAIMPLFSSTEKSKHLNSAVNN